MYATRMLLQQKHGTRHVRTNLGDYMDGIALGLGSAVTVAAAGLIVICFRREASASATVDPQTGNRILHYGRWFFFTGLAGTVFWPLFTALLFLLRYSGEANESWILASMNLFSLLGLLLLNEARSQITISDEGILGISAWRRGRRFIRWSSVESVRFSKANKWFLIRGEDGSIIRAHVWLKGVRDLARCLQERLPAEQYAAARTGFAEIGL